MSTKKPIEVLPDFEIIIRKDGEEKSWFEKKLEVIEVSETDYNKIVNELENPSEPNDRLKEAVKQRNKWFEYMRSREAEEESSLKLVSDFDNEDNFEDIDLEDNE
jgi:hypothetical protein